MLTSTGQALVEIQGLRFHYPGSDQDILRIPALAVSGRGLIALTGPSGAGKSTLVELLAGTLREPYEGSVQVLGTELRSLARDADRQRHVRRVGLIPQDYGLLPGMTVREVLEQDLSDAEVPRGERGSRIAEALIQVRMDGFADRPTERLSGGQRQRVAIARMLARDVDMVVADEPTANLDSNLVAETIGLLRQLADRVPIVVVTHDPSVAEKCDRTIVLQAAVSQETPADALIARKPGHRSLTTIVAVTALGLVASVGAGVILYVRSAAQTALLSPGPAANPSILVSPPAAGAPKPNVSPTPPPPPVARLVVAPGVGNVPITVTADASGSTGSAPLTFTFNSGDGTPAASQGSPTANHTFTSAGTFSVSVSISDAAGGTDHAQKSVTLNWTVPAPVQLQVWQRRLSEVTYGIFTVHQGTAFWTDPSHLVTASHVVTPDRTSVTLNMQGTANVTARDTVYDQAILTAGSPPAPDPTAVFTLRDGRPASGEPVWALCSIGPQFIIPLTVSDPSASQAEGTSLEDPTVTYSFPDALLLSGQIHPGCSGGPIIDGIGRVVGEMVAAGNGTTIAVPSVDIRAWLASLGLPNAMKYQEPADPTPCAGSSRSGSGAPGRNGGYETAIRRPMGKANRG